MEHGGNKKKYVNINNILYSEHAGALDFHRNGIDKIIVFGNTTRIDKNDEEIFLPNDPVNIREYEYLFHTHPPTPNPGSRIKDGILYEFPSIGDILHFCDKHNTGNTIGSLVVTPEGLYNIRCNNYLEKININENQENILYKEYYLELRNNNELAIKKYCDKFNINKFYKFIAQDYTYINNINNILKRYNLYIDYFPRKKINNMWIINDVHLRLP